MSDVVNHPPPTLDERYSSAITSSNLRLRAEGGFGDLELLIAVGWVREGVGPMLCRLMTEFDQIRAEVRGPGALNQTERFLILSRMRTLRPARVVLREFVLERAKAKHVPWEESVLFLLMGQVLDVFLDPKCHQCEGRGYHGGSHRGEPRIICKPCGGSTHRRDRIGKDAAQADFGAYLYAEMERHVDAVGKAISRARA